jgi:hypothetical protein
MDIWDETLGETGRHQWNKELRFKEVTTSEEGEDIWQDLQEGHRAGGLEANSWNFHYTT